MLSETEILDGLQFEFLTELNPVTTAGEPAYQITYQFAQGVEPDDRPGYTNWTAMTEAEQDVVRAALDHIETLINVEFVEVTGQSDPDLNLGKVALSPGTAGLGGISASWNGFDDITRYDGFAVFDYTLDITNQVSLILHELGHALGLDHPFEGTVIDPAFENNKYTLMSYTENPDNGVDSDAMMLFDIFALQDIWGAADSNSGDDTYTGPRTTTVDALWDSGGTDHIDGSDWGNGIRIDLREGYFSQFGSYEDLVIAFGTVIENATGGGGNDLITGNSAANTLVGKGGEDTLSGLEGNDTIKGKNGADSLDGGDDSDSIQGGSGKDSVTGGKGKDTLDGNDGKDTISGGNGHDLVRGGNGKDRLNGQKGNDTLKGGADADKFIFKAGQGDDVIADYETGLDKLVFKELGDNQTALAAASQSGDDVIFDFGEEGSLTVRDVTLSELNTDLLS